MLSSASTDQRLKWCCTPYQALSLGSLAAAPRRRQPQPVAEVAYNPEDIKARLSAVNVYTVANQKNEFVLVSGEVSLAATACLLPRQRAHRLGDHVTLRHTRLLVLSLSQWLGFKHTCKSEPYAWAETVCTTGRVTARSGSWGCSSSRRRMPRPSLTRQARQLVPPGSPRKLPQDR